MLEDLGRMRAALPEDRCVKLLESAARLSAGHVRRSLWKWRGRCTLG